MIVDINIKFKTLKENRVGKDSLDITKAISIEENVDWLDFINTENFYSRKSVKRIHGPSTDCEKILAHYPSHK